MRRNAANICKPVIPCGKVYIHAVPAGTRDMDASAPRALLSGILPQVSYFDMLLAAGAREIHLIAPDLSTYSEVLSETSNFLKQIAKHADGRLRMWKRILRFVKPIAQDLSDRTRHSWPILWKTSPWLLHNNLKDIPLTRYYTTCFETFLDDLYILTMAAQLKAEADIDIAAFKRQIEYLLHECRNSESIARLQAVKGFANGYSRTEVDKFVLKRGLSGEDAYDIMLNLLDLGIYSDLSKERAFLGIPRRAKKSLIAIKAIVRDIKRKRGVGKFLSVGREAISMASGMPLPRVEQLINDTDLEYASPIQYLSFYRPRPRRMITNDRSRPIVDAAMKICFREKANSVGNERIDKKVRLTTWYQEIWPDLMTTLRKWEAEWFPSSKV